MFDRGLFKSVNSITLCNHVWKPDSENVYQQLRSSTFQLCKFFPELIDIPATRTLYFFMISPTEETISSQQL